MKRIWVKLALVLMAVSVSGILIVTVLSIKEMGYHFSFYLEDMSRKHNQEIRSILEQNYKEQHKWDESSFSILSDIATVLDLRIVLYDQNKKLLGKVGQNLPNVIHQNSLNNLLPIQVDNTIVGYFSSQHNESAATKTLEQHFQMAHTNAMRWSMMVLTLLVSTVSILIARRIVRPITQMRNAAVSVGKGDYDVLIPIPKGEDELTELVNSFNSLVLTLNRQEELRRRLTSDVAHELRTPLNTLLAQVEGMIDGVWEASPEHLESTRAEVLRLTRLVHDLDQVNHTEAGFHQITLVEVNMSHVVHDVVESMKASFQKKGIHLESELVPEACIMGDERRLFQIMTNLLSNSLKHTLPEGKVRTTVKNEQNLISVTVEDTGTGIREQDLPYVFERFYRGDRSRHRESGGSGLGLTIAKGIVEAHNGEISIESKLGEGTKVTIRFPAFKTT